MTDKNFLAEIFVMLEQNRVDEVKTLLREKLGTWEFHELNPDRVVVRRVPAASGRTIRKEDRERFPIGDWIYEVVNEDTKLGYEEWLHHQLEAEESDQKTHRPPPTTRCPGCGNEIDLGTCHCGINKPFHDDMEEGHTFVPAGCDCGRPKEGG